MPTTLLLGTHDSKILTQALHISTLFSGIRQDEDLIEAWRKMKEKQGVDFNVLFDKSDLDRWDHSDFVLGLFSMSHMDYV